MIMKPTKFILAALIAAAMLIGGCVQPLGFKSNEIPNELRAKIVHEIKEILADNETGLIAEEVALEGQKPNSTGLVAEELPAQEGGQNAVMYFFWGEGCPHCNNQKPFLAELEERYPELEIRRFEIYKSPENANLFSELANAHEITPRGVPATFIGENHWIGYAASMKGEIEAKVKDCLKSGCTEPGKK
jgi:thiol-disulfide isomerase/thioredoxin